MTPEEQALAAQAASAQQQAVVSQQSLPATPQALTGDQLAAQMDSAAQSAMATPKDAGSAPNFAGMDPNSSAYQAAISQAMAGNQAPTPSATSEASPRFTSQQFDASPEMQAPKTLEAAKDEVEADKVRYQAKLAAATQEETQRAQADQQRRVDESLRNINALSEQMKGAGQIEPYKPTTMQKFALAISAFGAGYTGRENQALKLLEHQMDLDMESKKSRLNVAMEQLKMAGAQPQQIMSFGRQHLEQILAQQKAKLDTFDAQTQTLLAPFPQAQQKAKQTLEEAKARAAQEAFKNVAEHVGQETHWESAKTVTVMPGSAQLDKSSQGDKTSEGLKLAGLESAKGSLEKLIASGAPTSASLQAARENAERMAAGTKLAGEGLEGVAKAKIGRWLGSIPDNAVTGLSKAEGQKVLALRGVFRDVANAMVSKGALAPDQVAQQVEAWTAPLYSADAKQADAILRDWHARIEGASGVSPKREEKVVAAMARSPSATAPSQVPAAAPSPQAGKITPAELGKLDAHEKARYFEARLEKPGSPDYADAQRAIQSLTARARSR